MVRKEENLHSKNEMLF